MEGNSKCDSRGFTLVEMLITISIVAILSLLTMQTYRESQRVTSRFLAKSHMIKLQSIQSRHWLSTGAYVSLSHLPDIDASGVIIKEVASTASHYEFKAILTHFDKKSPCSTLIVNASELLPKACWSRF